MLAIERAVCHARVTQAAHVVPERGHARVEGRSVVDVDVDESGKVGLIQREQRGRRSRDARGHDHRHVRTRVARRVQAHRLVLDLLHAA